MIKHLVTQLDLTVTVIVIGILIIIVIDDINTRIYSNNLIDAQCDCLINNKYKS